MRVCWFSEIVINDGEFVAENNPTIALGTGAEDHDNEEEYGGQQCLNKLCDNRK